MSNEIFSLEWLAENIEWDKRLTDFDRVYALSGELRIRQAMRFIKSPEEAQNEEMLAQGRTRIYENFYRKLHSAGPPTTVGRSLDHLSPEEIGELTTLAQAFSNKLKEMQIVDHIQIYGIEANRGGRCFISESRAEEYEDE